MISCTLVAIGAGIALVIAVPLVLRVLRPARPTPGQERAERFRAEAHEQAIRRLDLMPRGNGFNPR